MDYHWSPRRAGPEQQNARLPPATRKPSVEVTLFDIEKDGDPRIFWYMYYDFIVTKNEAYFQLQPGYLPTESFPRRRKSEPVLIKGERRHPCRVPHCTADAFARHADLERHFKLVHEPSREQSCDYPNCAVGSPRSFPTNKIVEHYSDVHGEDLLTAKQGDDAAKIEKFLAAKVAGLNLSWWRCSKCKQRVSVKDDDYQCPRCKLLCEPERVAWRMSVPEGEGGGYAMGGGQGMGMGSDAYSSDLY